MPLSNFSSIFGDNWKKELLNFIVPRRCYHCNKFLQSDNQFQHRQICIPCFQALSPIDINDPKLCQVCCHPLQKFKKAMSCPDCRNVNYLFEKNVSLFQNDGIANTIIYKYKFASLQSYAKLIADFCYEHHKDYLANHDIFIPVTLNRAAMYKRGFCQVTEVVILLSEKLNIPYLKVVRKKSAMIKDIPQSQKSKAERKLSSYKRFAFIKKHSALLDNKRILIFDDIFTTGSTINAHVKHISENSKPNLIRSFTFARTFWKDVDL